MTKAKSTRRKAVDIVTALSLTDKTAIRHATNVAQAMLIRGNNEYDVAQWMLTLALAFSYEAK